jgi:hypothetical protein
VADFTARLTAGVTPTDWDDHAGSGVSRLNAAGPRAPRYLKATVGVPVTMKATIGGVEGPLDAALGGNLFTSDFGFAAVPVVASGAAGQSSVQTFTPPIAGHYLWIMRHANGGADGVHLDAENP